MVNSDLAMDEQEKTAHRYRLGGLSGVTAGACAMGTEAIDCSCTSAGHGASSL